MIRHFLLLLFIFFKTACLAQSPFTQTAGWITHPQAGKHAYGVFHFRKTIALDTKPSQFVVLVSGDQRYRLFVNGKSVATGPARSDVAHWHYETLDLAPFLATGKNVLAAVVWNDGEHSAWAQLSHQTGFFIQGKTAAEAMANTDTSWRVLENHAYTPQSTIAHITGAYEQVFAQQYPWGWETSTYNDSSWDAPVVSEPAFSNAHAGIKNDTARHLIARAIPLPEETPQRFGRLRRSNGLADVKDDFLKGSGSLAIHPWADVTLLIDQDVLTTAYPELLVSGGRGAKITLTYAESPAQENRNKGNRNEIEGKKITGFQDVFLPDGGANRLYRPLFYRTFRYIELHIENHQEPLELHNFSSVFTAYPFQEKARLVTNDSVLSKIWDVGWRTARLCAYETYMDCPYYEQLQYVGDTRIQALISLYVSGDDRLMRNAIAQIHYSLLPEGITQSRYPNWNQQIIPPFSLFWIAMLHDYWMHRSDDAFLKPFLPAVKRILDWHQQYLTSKSMLGKMPHWNFVDWAKEWPWTGIENESGVPPGTTTGNSTILTLQYVMALQKAADLYRHFGMKRESMGFLKSADKIKTATYKNCWNSAKGLLADTPEQAGYSQHAQAMGVLTGTFPQKADQAVLQKTLSDTALVQCTYYYKFYLLQALAKAGMGNQYLKELGPWKGMLDLGLTTFAEAPEPTRSDCHAWSASPCYDLLATVSGIRPASPHFATVQITPHLGDLTYCEAQIPHPSGTIAVKYEKSETGAWQVTATLPEGVTGYLIWKGERHNLKSAANQFVFK
jgi:alpha-L-rhamnosidase